MTAQPPLALPAVGFPASAAYLTAQLYNPLAYLYSQKFIEAYKTADFSLTSTTTFASDPELQCTLAANSVYRVEFFLHHAALNAARLQTQWLVPSGAGGNRSAVGPDQGQILSTGSAGGTGRYGVHAFTTACVYGNRDSTANLCYSMEEGIVTTGTSGGTLALQAAQVTASASSSRIAAGSYMRVKLLS